MKTNQRNKKTCRHPAALLPALAATLTLLLAAGGCKGRQPDKASARAVTAAPAKTPERAVAKAPARADPSDWCAGHALPESMCTKCNPGLVKRFRAAGDWCAEHAFPESACPHCNPMQPPGAKASSGSAASGARVGDAGDWCAGHALPESMCTKCNPGLVKRFRAAGDWCAEHAFPESACPHCHPMQPPAGEAAAGAIAAGTRVRFSSPSIERAAGIETVPARRQAVTASIRCTARIGFDRNRVAEIRAPVSGIVRGVLVDVGQQVVAGGALFTLENASVGALQERRQAARLRVEAARSNFARQEKLRADAIASQRQVELARQELEAARAEARTNLRALQISGASKSGRAGLFRVRAPIAGTVVRRPAVRGVYASGSKSLATVADTRVMWALVDVPEWDAASVRLEQAVEVVVDGIAGKAFRGKVSWISAEVDPRTRTVAARVALDNAAGDLRAGQFARAVIQLPSSPSSAIAVPVGAVQPFGEESVVFVRTGEGQYEPRSVVPGRSNGRRVQITGPVQAGDLVVTTGAFLLRTEIDRGSIGAGCCEVDGRGGE